MKTRLGVIFGGRSTEHEISVLSAQQAMAAVDTDRYEIIPIYITKTGHMYTGPKLINPSAENFRDIPALLKDSTEVYLRPVYGDYNLYPAHPSTSFFSKKGAEPVATLDVVLPVLHGSNVEDGIFEGVLQTIGIPYAGCDTLSSANGMDKITMKMILASDGIPVVDYVWFTDRQWFSQRDRLIEKIESKLGYPVIVKPANLGSSVGIGAADNREQLLDRVEDAARYSARIIVEDMVENLKEINCSVLGDADDHQSSVCEEPIKTGDILSYEDKYMGGSSTKSGMQASEKRIPAELSDEMTERIRTMVGETFRVLSCHGVSRIDVMIDEKDDSVYVNEINTIPGSLSYYLWEASGISFTELMDRLVQLALKRKRETERKTFSYDANIFAMGGGAKGSKGGLKGIK